MRKEEFKEGLGDLAHMAEMDHEVQMARADLYKIAKYAIKLHEMLKRVSEQEGLEGWVQSKITKASDYLDSVYHNLDYKMNFEKQNNPSEELELDLSMESAYKSSLSKNLTKNLQEKSKKKINSNVDEAHGNSKIYDKCWNGYKKVPGKKRGEKNSCVKK